jgi:hypothetical protein
MKPLGGQRRHGQVAVAAAALKKGARVIGIDRSRLGRQLGSRYDSGESIRSLAASTGRSYGFIHRLLTESGVELRQRGDATKSRTTRTSSRGTKVKH